MKKEKDAQTAPEGLENSVETSGVDVETPAAKEESKITKVGDLLKEMRLQKGLRIPDVSKKLCIRKSYLEAIEEGNYVEVPPFPYGVGFVRSYAAFLGLNSSNIVELYKDETTLRTDKEMFVLEAQSEASVPSKKYLLVSVLAIVIAYAAWSAYHDKYIENTVIKEDAEQVVEVSATEEMPIVVEDFSVEPVMEEEGEDNNVAAPAEQQITVTEASFVAPVAEAQVVADSVAEPHTADAETAVSSSGIVVKVKEETWVEVKDADKLYLSKVLQAGDSYTIPEGKGMILSVGKYEGVDVEIDGVLTQVVKPNKKMNIKLDQYLNANH